MVSKINRYIADTIYRIDGVTFKVNKLEVSVIYNKTKNWGKLKNRKKYKIGGHHLMYKISCMVDDYNKVYDNVVSHAYLKKLNPVVIDEKELLRLTLLNTQIGINYEELRG